MNKLAIFMAAIIAMLLAAAPAHARKHKHPRIDHQSAVQCVQDNNGRTTCPPAFKEVSRASYGDANGNEAQVIGGRPAECNIRIAGRLIPYCGCAVSLKVFGRPVRELFLASNWLKFPRATPSAGMVAARRGHVFYILDYLGGGNALVYDPNSGGRKTRVHVRSIKGYVVVNPHGSKVASR